MVSRRFRRKNWTTEGSGRRAEVTERRTTNLQIYRRSDTRKFDSRVTRIGVTDATHIVSVSATCRTENDRQMKLVRDVAVALAEYFGDRPGDYGCHVQA